MWKCLKNVDWPLLHQQKQVLLEIRNRRPEGSPERDALSGILHLLDALEDEAGGTKVQEGFGIDT